MNKKRNYARTMLLGALVCGIAGPAFVGCKDYDDDIDSLQAQVNTLNQGLADLKKLVESGKSITEVTPVEGGFRITFNDNTSYEIVNGTSGTSGSVVTVNDEGHLFIDGVDKGKVVNENSATSADLVITIDDEGYICVNGTRQTGAQLSMTPGDSYAVVKDKVIEFYLPNEKGEMPTEPIKVWKSGLLTGLMTLPTHLYEISDNGLLFPTIYGVDAKGNYVRLYAGKTTLQYEINPKSADVTVNGLTTKQIASRAVNEKFQISGEPTIADGILSVQAKAMDGLFSYNRLYASDGTTEVKDYVYRFDESTIDGDKGIIDPLANIIALDVTSQQNENLISDYMLAFDYNISVDDVTIEKKVVKDGKTTYENSLYATEGAAKAGDAKANFTLVYDDGKGQLKLADEIAAFFYREGRTNVEGKFEFTANGFDEHVYSFSTVEFLFTDGTNKEDHSSYVTLSDDGTLTVNEASDEKGSSIGRTPIVKITLTSDKELNHGKDVKTVYAKIIIAEQEIEHEIPAYTENVTYMLNNIGKAQYLQMDKLYGYVADHLNILGSDKFYATYTQFNQILDEAPDYDNEIQLALTAETSTDKNEWLAVYVPNYKKAGTYKVKGVFTSVNEAAYPPLYVEYTVTVTYPEGIYLTPRTDASDGGNFWRDGKMLVYGVFDAGNDYQFRMGGRIADAFKYSLPNDENPWDADWEGDTKENARVNIQYTFVNKNEKNATIGDLTAATKEGWLGEISITQIEDNADYRDIEVQPITWFNLDLDKMINETPITPAATISTTDELNTLTEDAFTVRFISPLKALDAKGATLDADNTTIDQEADLLKSVVVYDREDAVLYKDKAFQQITVADGVKKAANDVYQMGDVTFEWADDVTKQFASDMEQRGGKCTLDQTTGVITFHASGEVGEVKLQVKVSMTCPWRKLEQIVTVSVE